jgi:hypothetical protein
VDGTLNAGHQLRRHSVTWRQVGSFEAFRLFLRDLFVDQHTKDLVNAPWIRMESYQEISNKAALIQLGPPRSNN